MKPLTFILTLLMCLSTASLGLAGGPAPPDCCLPTADSASADVPDKPLLSAGAQNQTAGHAGHSGHGAMAADHSDRDSQPASQTEDHQPVQAAGACGLLSCLKAPQASPQPASVTPTVVVTAAPPLTEVSLILPDFSNSIYRPPRLI
ncbi:MAG: hypothetical protein LBP95_12620 [Deltaproteobacteria bacterium]|nr:hypothetical protein [Deltaproteobacteria bacterium]